MFVLLHTLDISMYEYLEEAQYEKGDYVLDSYMAYVCPIDCLYLVVKMALLTSQ